MQEQVKTKSGKLKQTKDEKNNCKKMPTNKIKANIMMVMLRVEYCVNNEVML